MSILSDSILVESKSARDSQLLEIPNDRAAAIMDKAKAICFAAWEGVGITTTEQMGEFYEVEVEAVQKVVQRNRDELISDGLQILRGKKLKEVMDKLSITSQTVNLTVWTPRSGLRLGMLLQNSHVAQQVRTLLLNGVEAIGKQTQPPSSYDDRLLVKAKWLEENFGLKPGKESLDRAMKILDKEDAKAQRAAKALLADLPIRAKALLDAFRRGGHLTFNDITQWEGFPVVETRFDLVELEQRGLIERFVDDEGVTYYRASQTESTTIDQTPRLDRSVETAR